MSKTRTELAEDMLRTYYLEMKYHQNPGERRKMDVPAPDLEWLSDMRRHLDKYRNWLANDVENGFIGEQERVNETEIFDALQESLDLAQSKMEEEERPMKRISTVTVNNLEALDQYCDGISYCNEDCMFRNQECPCLRIPEDRERKSSCTIEAFLPDLKLLRDYCRGRDCEECMYYDPYHCCCPFTDRDDTPRKYTTPDCWRKPNDEEDNND